MNYLDIILTVAIIGVVINVVYFVENHGMSRKVNVIFIVFNFMIILACIFQMIEYPPEQKPYHKYKVYEQKHESKQIDKQYREIIMR